MNHTHNTDGSADQRAIEELDNYLDGAIHMLETDFNRNQIDLAARQNNQPAVRYLHEYGADELKALYDEADAWDVSFMGHKANTNSRNSWLGTTMIIPTHPSNHLRLLLDPEDVITAVTFRGWTAIHLAAMNSDVDMIQWVLAQGFDIEGTDNDDYSALHHAAAKGNHQVCEFLLQSGAMVNKTSRKTNHTPMSLLLSKCKWWEHRVTKRTQHLTQTVYVLLDHGAKVADKLNQKSMLEIAAGARHNGCLRNAMTQHIARMKYLNLKVAERDWQIIECNDYFKEYYQRCMQEIQRMEATRFYYNLPFSILLRAKKVISEYVRNKEMMKAFGGGGYDRKFPIYFVSLRMRIERKIETQRLRNSAGEILSEIFQFNNRFHPVNQKILDFLSDAHLSLLKK